MWIQGGCVSTPAFSMSNPVDSHPALAGHAEPQNYIYTTN